MTVPSPAERLHDEDDLTLVRIPGGFPGEEGPAWALAPGEPGAEAHLFRGEVPPEVEAVVSDDPRRVVVARGFVAKALLTAQAVDDEGFPPETLCAWGWIPEHGEVGGIHVVYNGNDEGCVGVEVALDPESLVSVLDRWGDEHFGCGGACDFEIHDVDVIVGELPDGFEL